MIESGVFYKIHVMRMIGEGRRDARSICRLRAAVYRVTSDLFPVTIRDDDSEYIEDFFLEGIVQEKMNG